MTNNSILALFRWCWHRRKSRRLDRTVHEERGRRVRRKELERDAQQVL